MPYYEGFSKRLESLLTEKNMKNAELARKIKVDRSAVGSMIAERSNPSDQTISLSAKALNTSEEYLKFGTGEKELIPSNEFSDAYADIIFSGDELAKSILIAYTRMSEQEKTAVKRFILETAEEYKKRKAIKI